MRIIPAVDLMDGKAVQLQGGSPHRVLWQDDDPLAVAQRWWERGAQALHVVDLSRALDRGDEGATVQAILAQAQGPVSVGGGLRTTAQIEDILEAHPEARAVVATRAWRDPMWLEHIAGEFPAKVIVALELKRGTIAVKGWTERLKLTLEEGLFRLADLDLAGVLLTDIDREGQLAGPNVETAKHAAQELDVPVIVSGGISTLDHIRSLQSASVWGCIIGTSLYTGELELEDAMEVTAA